MKSDENLYNRSFYWSDDRYNSCGENASVVKLADALDSGSSGSDPMQVQVLSLAPS